MLSSLRMFVIGGACVLLVAVGCSDGKDHESGTGCGNGSIDAGELCDDGNRVSGDGCTEGCQLEDGDAVIVDLAEGLLQFEYSVSGPNGFCPEVDSVAHFELTHLANGRYLFSSSIFRAGVLGSEECLQGVSSSTCIVEEPFTSDELDEAEVKELLDGFRRVRITNVDDPECGLPPGCLERAFSWLVTPNGRLPYDEELDGRLAWNDGPCEPRIDPVESGRLVALLEQFASPR